MKISTPLAALSKNNLIRKGILFTVFASLNNGINFLLIFLLSIYLTKEDFGVLNLFNVFILVLSVLISVGTQSYFGVVFFKKNRIYLIQILNSILLISCVVFVLFLLLIIILPDTLSNLLGFSSEYQFYGLTLCLLQLYYSLNLEVFRLEEKPIQYGILSLFWVVSNFAFTYLFCISYKNGWVGRVDAQIISAVIVFLVNLIVMYKMGYLRLLIPTKIQISKTLNFGLPLVPHNSTVWIRQGFDRYIINFFHGAAMVGNYSFAYNLSGVLLMIGTAFNSTNSVYIFKTLKSNKDENKPQLVKQIYLMIVLFASLTVIGYLLSIFVVNFFIPKYRDSIVYFLPLFFAAFFQCVYYLFVNYLLFFNKTRLLMYITFSISIFHFLVSFAITRYSVVYVAYLSLISNFLICLIVIFYTNKKCNLFSKVNVVQK